MKSINDKQIKNFKKDGVLILPNFLSRDLCEEMVNYLENAEEEIINRFREKKRFLSTEVIKNKEYIKYFEFPLEDNADLFGKAINSDMFEVSKKLLESKVRLKSVEIHSRFSGCSLIPKHQDNAYYGLDDGKALTFYIALNPQKESEGGLIYIKNNIEDEWEHKPSKINGFSLNLERNDLPQQEIRYDFSAGDCSVHHSRSIHFAEEVPSNIERAWVLRTSLYSLEDKVRPEHKKWYLNMIKKNRSYF